MVKIKTLLLSCSWRLCSLHPHLHPDIFLATRGSQGFLLALIKGLHNQKETLVLQNLWMINVTSCLGNPWRKLERWFRGCYPSCIHPKSVLSRFCFPMRCRRRWRRKVGYSALWRSQGSPAGVVTHCEQAQSFLSLPAIEMTFSLVVLLPVHFAVWLITLVALVGSIVCICTISACFKTIN